MPGNGLFKQWDSFGYCPPIAYKYEHESNKIKNYFFFFSLGKWEWRVLNLNRWSL
jgi:hypothetical protein